MINKPMNIAITILKKEEGWRNKPYYCSEGYPTIGYGFKLGEKNTPLPSFFLPLEVGEVWLTSEVGDVYSRLFNRLEGLNAVRAAVLVSMAFQLGTVGLYKFKRMWAALEASDYDKASKEMLDSLWASQTPQRARRHAEMMKTGELLSFYGG